VSRSRCILVLFLLVAAVCIFALPRVDLPETVFNEADAPTNLVPHVWRSIRVIPSGDQPITVLTALTHHCAVRAVSSLVCEAAAVPRQIHQRYLEVLCTLLI